MADPLKLQALMAVALPAPDAPDWEAKMRAVIARGHLAAYLTGVAERSAGSKARAWLAKLIGPRALAKGDRERLKSIVEKQLKYLQGFVEARGDMSDAAIAARAQMYAGATRGSYNAARWGDIPLPFQPTEGSECLTNCRCSWDVQQLDGDGNYDAYWRFGDTEKHCATCPEREAASPYRIRDGILQRDGSTKSQTAQERAIFAAIDEKGSRKTPRKGGASHGGGGSEATPVKSRTPEETHSVLMSSNSVKRLTTNQDHSLSFYQAQGHETVNKVLRGGDATDRQRHDTERTTKNIDQVMNRSRLTENAEVHRGMIATDPAAHAALARMQPGATLREHGYMSTSADPEVIKRFGGNLDTDPYPGDTLVTMRVRVRAGTRAVYMPAVRKRSGANVEKELLIDRGAVYRVTDRREKNGRVVIDMDVLGHDD